MSQSREAAGENLVLITEMEHETLKEYIRITIRIDWAKNDLFSELFVGSLQEILAIHDEIENLKNQRNMLFDTFETKNIEL